MTAHSIAARNEDSIVCLCGAVIPSAPDRHSQRRAWWQHSDEAREEEGDG